MPDAPPLDDSPAGRFERYLREVERNHPPLPSRLEQSWADRVIMALIAAGGLAIVGALVCGAARMVGLMS